MKKQWLTYPYIGSLVCLFILLNTPTAFAKKLLKPSQNDKADSSPEMISVRTSQHVMDFGPQDVGAFTKNQSDFLEIVFYAPQNWILQEERAPDHTYQKLRIYGPRNEDKTYSNNFVIVREPINDSAIIAKRITQRVEQIEKLHSGRKHSNRIITLPQIGKSRQVVLSYELWLPPMSPGGKYTPIWENRYYCLRDGFLYQFIFYADQRDYDSLKGVFEQFVQSIKWK